MQILLNELSLTGQFLDEDIFLCNGLIPFIAILKEMQNFSVKLLKKSNVWEEKITQSSTLYSIISNTHFRKSDEILRFKSAIASLCLEPFWDDDIRQDSNATYTLNGINIGGSSPAEASERDKTVISFKLSLSSTTPLPVVKNGVNIPLENLTEFGRLTELLWEKNQISFEKYIKSRFSHGKFDFSNVVRNMDFSDVQTEEQSLFIDTFRRFEELTWSQIYGDRGLDFKQYHGTINQLYRNKTTYKFRASQKIRCHGYRENDLFKVIGFETDHQLSDHG